MKSLNVKSKRTLLALGFIVVILLFILWYSAPIEQGTLPVNITINTLDGQATSRSLPLQIVLESEVDIANAKVEIALPDDVLLLEGDLSWKIDLIAHESQVWTLYVEPNNLGLETITVTVSGKISSGKIQTASAALYLLSERAREGGKPEVPLDVYVTVFPDPALGEVVQLHSLVTALTDSPNTIFEIILPEGLSLVEGERKITGDLAAYDTLEMNVGIRVDQEGEWPVTVIATSDTPGGGTWSRVARIYFQVGTSDEYVITQFPLGAILARETEDPIAEEEDVYYPPLETPPDTRRPKESNHTPGSTGGQLFIYGYWQYLDRNGVARPIPWAKVEIWDENSGADYLIGVVHTSNSGYYSATFFNTELSGYAIIHSPHFS